MAETDVGSPDLRIIVPLRLPIRSPKEPVLLTLPEAHRQQWRCAESLPAYSGGTVLDLHQLPRHNRLNSALEPSSFVRSD